MTPSLKSYNSTELNSGKVLNRSQSVSYLQSFEVGNNDRKFSQWDWNSEADLALIHRPNTDWVTSPPSFLSFGAHFSVAIWYTFSEQACLERSLTAIMHVQLVLTQYHFRAITLSLLLFPGLPRICARRELQSPSRDVTVDMLAENNSFPSGKPWLSFSATLEECSPDASESICSRLPKQRSSNVAGEGTEPERGTGISRRTSFIYSHVSAEWEPSGSSNNSRLVN